MNTRKPLGILLAILIILAAGYVLFNGDDAAPQGTTAEETPKEAVTPAPAAKTPQAERAETAYTATRTLENGRYVTTVTLTSAGFQPQIVTVNRGESVRFVNKSGGAMRIASNEFQGVPLLKGLNQEKSVGLNGTYEVTLSEVGVWGYQNGIGTAQNVTGIIHVK